MKLMKRILAIVCTFVMIISMATGVNAVEQPSKAPAQTRGSITITKAKAGEEYKVYKILSLESYDESKKAYSYVKTGNVKWDAFVDGASDYLNVNNGYVTFKSNKDNLAGRREFALKAMKYAKENHIDCTARAIASDTKDTGITVKFDNLELGYYLVESSVGTACSLGTTNPNAIIEDKHEAPTVDKVVVDGTGVGGNITDNGKKNSVNIGDVVAFKVTIFVKPNARNYVLHDVMDKHLQFLTFMQHAYVHLKDENKNQHLAADDFVINTKPNDECTFEISFTDKFYQTYENNINSGNLDEITFEYGAQVTNDAPIDTAMPNKVHLTYGEHSSTSKSETNTYTWGIPVFKYTEKAGQREALAGAEFILSTENSPTEKNALKFTRDDIYRYDPSKQGTNKLVSGEDGFIQIGGLGSGTYYLKETKAPAGYNLLKNPITIVVEGDPNTGSRVIKVEGEVVQQVDVKNNTGSLLPSTGGMGTTLIYVVGSILVLASGIVLFSKRKEGTN